MQFCVQKINMAISDVKLRSTYGKPYSGPSEVIDSDGLDSGPKSGQCVTVQH